MIVSFDVFETVVVRALASPDGVFRRVAFRLIERGLLQPNEREEWVDLRYREEIRLWREQGSRFSLRDIYHGLQGMAASEKGAAVEIELAVEAELWRAVPGALARIEEERAKGNKIVFVSDGYFPEAFLKENLQGLLIARPEDEVFSSCERGAVKHDGTLYKKLREQFGEKWVRHYGNAQSADVLQAQWAGLQAVHLPDGELTPREQKSLKVFRKHRAADAGESIIGAARIARLNVAGKMNISQQPDAGRLRVLSGVGAPVFFLYAHWLVRQATRDKVKKLAFLSRDGFVLKQIFDKLKHEIQSVYVLVSRRAVRPSVFFEEDEKKFKSFFVEDPDLESILYEMDLSDEEKKQLILLSNNMLGGGFGIYSRRINRFAIFL
jgi:predicted HAD superfamily hydrolase